MPTRILVIEKSKTVQIGKQPMVLVLLKLWREMEDYLEDQEALASKKFQRRIQKARRDGARGKVLYPFTN